MKIFASLSFCPFIYAHPAVDKLYSYYVWFHFFAFTTICLLRFFPISSISSVLWQGLMYPNLHSSAFLHIDYATLSLDRKKSKRKRRHKYTRWYVTGKRMDDFSLPVNSFNVNFIWCCLWREVSNKRFSIIRVSNGRLHEKVNLHMINILHTRLRN